MIQFTKICQKSRQLKIQVKKGSKGFAMGSKGGKLKVEGHL